jgi:hypothetical protein
MGAKTDYLENSIINHNFGGAAFTQPSSWWIQLYSADPTDIVDEFSTIPLAGSRVEIDAWTIANNEASNTNAIQFAAVPVTETWVVSHYVVWDAETNGNALYHGQFRITKTLEEGDIFIIAPNQLKIREL